MNSIKINSLELENVKRVHHVTLTPRSDGLTIIGGKNAQGKTSILDAIAWALGGDKYKPAKAENDNAPTPPKLKVELSNGLIVERRGKNGSLYITDPTGQKAGQKLLDSFVEKLAIDLPKFLEASDKEKAKTLLQIIGVEEQLEVFNEEEARLYNERLTMGRIRDQKKSYFDEMGPYKENLPEDPISPLDLIQRQQKILLQNAENEKARDQVGILEMQQRTTADRIQALIEQQEKLKNELKKLDEDYKKIEHELTSAKKTASELKDESTEAIENDLRNIEEINSQINFNTQKKKAETEYLQAEEEWNDLDLQIKQVRADKLQLLNGADLPLPELSVDSNGLTYKGHAWNDMSSAEQLRVAVAIVRRLRPECGFVLLDKLEQFDMDTLNEFGAWLEKEGLQVIATRVSTGDECQIVIEDGYIKGDLMPTEKTATSQAAQPVMAPATGWEAGMF